MRLKLKYQTISTTLEVKMLGLRTGEKLEKYVKDYVVFDLETTGVSPQSDAAIEISAIKVRDGKVVDKTDSFRYYVCKCNAKEE